MLSKQHKTIFVHIPKTGGQSVALPFLQDLGLDWEQREALLMRRATRAEEPNRLAHLYAREYVALGFVTQAEFDSFIKFSVVRHPYARAVSEYVYRMGQKGWLAQWVRSWQARDFARFVARKFKNSQLDSARHMCPQVDYVMDAQGRLMVDHVIDHAQLAEAIVPIYGKIFGSKVELPRSNVRRAAPQFTVEVLSAAQKDFLYQRYRDDFEAFGFLR